MSKDQPITTWALIATTALSAAGWVRESLKDGRTADAGIVVAATELVDRLMAESAIARDEIKRMRAEMADVRTEAEECKRRYDEVTRRLDQLTNGQGVQP